MAYSFLEEVTSLLSYEQKNCPETIESVALMNVSLPPEAKLLKKMGI
jgi:hypothetical protein